MRLSKRTTRTPPNAAEIAAQLLARVPASSTSDDASTAADALQSTAASLVRFLGSDGCHALLTRALRRAAENHPALTDIGVTARPTIVIGGVAECVTAHGVQATAAGLEAVLQALVESLGRLIGDELAMKILERSDEQ